MYPYPLLATAGYFIKAASEMPDPFKFTLLSLLLLTALCICFINKLPAILHEAPPTIRALREQPVKSLPKGKEIDGLGERALPCD